MSNHIDPKIQEIIDRHAAATPGPWKFIDLGEDREYALFGRDGVHGTRILDFGAAPDIYDQTCGQCPNFENEAFIENAWADIAYLLSQVEFWRKAAETQMENNLAILKEHKSALEYPKATKHDEKYGGWRLDYQFLRDVEMEIRQSEHWEECPSMEGIELALLTAQKVMKRRALSHLKGE